jgi:hypothetical protein
LAILARDVVATGVLAGSGRRAEGETRRRPCPGAGGFSTIAIDGLWALEFGHGAANNGPVTTLFFTAGPNDEEDGLFGSITAG